MAIGEFTKYGLVFASSLTGGVAGYFYSNRATNLRMRLEKKGIRVLRSSDKLWMYERIIKQNREEIQKIEELKEHFKENNTANPTEAQAIELLNWCEKKLTDVKYNSSKWETRVAKLCAYPV